MIKSPLTGFRRQKKGRWGVKGLPSWGGDAMSKDRDQLPDKKEEERDILAKVIELAPLLGLVLQLLDLILKLAGVYN